MERDTDVKDIEERLMISTHTLTWSVTISIGTLCSILTFQLTRSRGAWPLSKHRYLQKRSFQLTRSRGAWRDKISSAFEYAFISTHTLTWSVTIQHNLNDKEIQISTHTLTWSVTTEYFALKPRFSFQLTRSRGAWRHTKALLWYCKNFNSHAHVERDLINPFN